MSAVAMMATRDILVAQLLAARTQAEATITQLDATLAVLGVPMADSPDDALDAGCTHPRDERDNLTEMGGPLEWRCRRCGFHSTTDSPTED